MAEAFLYCWTDNKSNMLYIGAHKGSPNDGYVCSSNLMLEQYNIRSKDFSRQIIAEGTWDDIFKLEGKILLALNVKEDDSFYNMHNGSGDFRNKFVTREARKKISESKKGKPGPNKGKKFGTCWNKGKTNIYSEETIEKLRQAGYKQKGFWTGKKLPEHVTENLRNINKENMNAAKAISTPYGIFPSLISASRELNMSKWKVSKLVKENQDWRKI